MVAGGWHHPNLNVSSVELDTVEVLVLGQSFWQQTEPLPVNMRGLGATVIDNVPYFFGNDIFMHKCCNIFLFHILS